MKNLILILFLAFGVFSLSSQNIIAFDEANAPFMYSGSTSPAGVYPAIIKEAFFRMRESASLITYPWKRVIEGLESASLGCGGIYMNAERLKKYDYSKPFYSEVMGLYVIRERAFSYKKIEDLYGKIVGAHTGWTYGDAFDSAINAGKIMPSLTPTDEQNLKMLSLGRNDVVIANPEAADLILVKLGLKDRVIRLPDNFSSIDVHLAFNKKAEKAELLKRFDAIIASMKKDGTFDKLVLKELLR